MDESILEDVCKTKYPKTERQNFIPLAQLKSFVVDRSATNVENSVYPPPNKQNETEHHTVFVGPTKDQVVFFTRKTTFVRITTQRTSTNKNKNKRSITTEFQPHIFIFFTLALFSDGKIRQQNPLSQKEGRKIKT